MLPLPLKKGGLIPFLFPPFSGSRLLAERSYDEPALLLAKCVMASSARECAKCVMASEINFSEFPVSRQ